MTIREIAVQLNELSKHDKYQIGKLQEIRKDIKGLSRRPGRDIFRSSTISDDGWAFHYGGRGELQYNIGFEEKGKQFRYGIAFSLEPSQSLTDVSVLYPKILKLNCIIREQSEFFKDYSMWWWYDKSERSKTCQVKEIPAELTAEHHFIFIGKTQDSKNIDYNEILSTFDDLLNIYIEVESENGALIQKSKSTIEFIFNSSNKKLPSHKTVSTEEREISIDVRHSLLQEKLAEKLREEFGKKNVGMENSFSGSLNRVDVTVNNNGKHAFYEVKVASSAKACLRQATGQLLEYAFWPGKKHADKIIVAGEHALDTEGDKYISFLRDEFKLPLDYKQIKL